MATKARGGLARMRVNFNGQGKTLEQLFGGKPIEVTQMTKLLWVHIKRNKLVKKI
jgi:hypothetical protein